MTIEYAATSKLLCPVCGVGLDVRLAKGRRSGETFLMAVCPDDGRHIRAFINDQTYVRQILERLEAKG